MTRCAAVFAVVLASALLVGAASETRTPGVNALRRDAAPFALCAGAPGGEPRCADVNGTLSSPASFELAVNLGADAPSDVALAALGFSLPRAADGATDSADAASAAAAPPSFFLRIDVESDDGAALLQDAAAALATLAAFSAATASAAERGAGGAVALRASEPAACPSTRVATAEGEPPVC
jgi:hypothetical protein